MTSTKGTLYAIASNGEVVETHHRGHFGIKLAIELLKLASCHEQADALTNVWLRGWEQDDTSFQTADLDELIADLNEVFDLVPERLTDANGDIPESLMPEIRSRATLLRVGADLGPEEPWAVTDALSSVSSVLAFLVQCRERGLRVALD